MWILCVCVCVCAIFEEKMVLGLLASYGYLCVSVHGLDLGLVGLVRWQYTNPGPRDKSLNKKRSPAKIRSACHFLSPFFGSSISLGGLKLKKICETLIFRPKNKVCPQGPIFTPPNSSTSVSTCRFRTWPQWLFGCWGHFFDSLSFHLLEQEDPFTIRGWPYLYEDLILGGPATQDSHGGILLKCPVAQLEIVATGATSLGSTKTSDKGVIKGRCPLLWIGVSLKVLWLKCGNL